MAPVAQYAVDEELRPPASAFHSHIVIEFQSEHIDSGEGLDQFGRSAAEIGRVPDRPGRSLGIARVDAKREGRFSVVRNPQRPQDQVGTRFERLPVRELAG